jgi:[ribosomal protein S5]-alanine N-acetyltransferase
MHLSLTHAVIRTYTEADGESLALRINNKDIAANMIFIPHPYTLNDAHCFVAKCFGAPECTNFAIANESGVIGGIGLRRAEAGFQDVQKHVAEIGYWLAEEYWNRGITTEAVIAFTEWGFRTFGLRRIYAAVFARNTRSSRVLEKAGYEYEGRQRARYFRDGEFIDGLQYAKVHLAP